MTNSLARRVLIGIACLLSIAASAASGQSFPSRTIRIVDAYSPGGASDAYARIIAAKLTDGLKQPVVVENKPGASGIVGAETVVRAPPDGYTLLLGVNTVLAASPSLNSRLPYDPLKDLAPVTGVASGAYVLVAPSSSSAGALQDLIALARARPGKLNYASAGVGSGTHLVCELLKRRTGVDITHIPYKAGTALVAAVVSGEADLGCISISAAIGQINGGRLKALAVTSAKRLPVLPNVPTVGESGYADFEAMNSWGLYAPAATPKEVTALINTEVRRILDMPDVRERFAGLGVVAAGSTPEELGAGLAAETTLWAEVIKAAGIRAE